MKFLRNVSFVVMLAFMFCISSAGASEVLRISSTIGPVDAGMLPLLADEFTKKTGIEITLEKAGTGKTLEKAKSGNFDLVMVKKIASAKVPFVSRGDKSGTHVKEMDIWAAAEITPEGTWYEVWKDGDKGNKATTLYANEKQAYTLMDRATYLTLKDEIKLVPLVEADPLMLNLIAIIRVNPDKFSTVHKDEALQFADWVVEDEAQILIRDFGKDKYGQPLFFPNSDQWNAKNKK